MSLPVWEEWIEIKSGSPYPVRPPSLPVWEEWIEISPAGRNFWARRLFPYGKSGLKSHQQRGRSRYAESLPVWEEWIEMEVLRHCSNYIRSLPVWEEWIEIMQELGETLQGEVSSRMGRVD